MSSTQRSTTSTDGTTICYETHGEGPLALVFVHGWCCNRTHWQCQMEHFAKEYQVVALDLGGHGASAQGRAQWTMRAFAEDLEAVVDALALKRVVLVGHSMGGYIIVEAARLLGERVVGLIGADTLWDVERQRTPEQVEAAIADLVEPLRNNFRETATEFVEEMFLPTSDPDLRRETVAAMAAVPTDVGAGAMEAITRNDENLCAGVRELKVPIAIINSAEQGETNLAAAQRSGMQVVFMKNVGHFVMREDPDTFNRHLGELVQKMAH
jgi:pimeloyl-ACP methyl ester carboxylesterase